MKNHKSIIVVVGSSRPANSMKGWGWRKECGHVKLVSVDQKTRLVRSELDGVSQKGWRQILLDVVECDNLSSHWDSSLAKFSAQNPRECCILQGWEGDTSW